MAGPEMQFSEITNSSAEQWGRVHKSDVANFSILDIAGIFGSLPYDLPDSPNVQVGCTDLAAQCTLQVRVRCGPSQSG